VESSCEFGIEPSGELSSVLRTMDLSSSAQLHRKSTTLEIYLMRNVNSEASDIYSKNGRTDGRTFYSIPFE
jgi:hypothetical protein